MRINGRGGGEQRSRLSMAASCLVAEGVKDPASKIVRARIPKRSRLPRPKRRALVGPVKLKAEAANHGYSPSSSPFFPPGQRSYKWPFPWALRAPAMRNSTTVKVNAQGSALFSLFYRRTIEKAKLSSVTPWEI